MKTRYMIPVFSIVVLFMGIGNNPANCQIATGSKSKTYVIVHGAWGGGWAFRKVDTLLTSKGHKVFRPTLTGQGERVHLATPEIGLETHITDVVNMILFEDLREVLLVGHSYGGMVVTGVADRIPDRICHIIYLDAFVPENGESTLSLLVPGMSDLVKKEARNGFIIPPWLKPDQPLPHDVPHPLKTWTDPIVLKNKSARKIPATYILTVDEGKKDEEDDFAPAAKRAKARGWPILQLKADHNPQWSAPDALVEMLSRIP